MEKYKLIVYQSVTSDNCYSPNQHAWIELIDTHNHVSHVFRYTPGDKVDPSGGYGIFRKMNTIPSRVVETIHIPLTESAFAEMVKEGESLDNQFLMYDDFSEIPLGKCH